MLEVYGDFWEYAPNYSGICVTTNGIVKRDGRLVMGGGMAKQFSDRYPKLDAILGAKVRAWGNFPFVIKQKSGPAVLSFPTKAHFKNPSPLSLVRESAELIVAQVNANPDLFSEGVLSTRPGCGLGGLSWDVVKPVLERAGWDDRFTIIAPESER